MFGLPYQSTLWLGLAIVMALTSPVQAQGTLHRLFYLASAPENAWFYLIRCT
jgi:hypothetical protein